MICTASASAAQFHFGADGKCVTVYHKGQEVMRAAKPGHMVRLAQDCLNGGLIVMIEGEPVQIVDHAWLLRLAATCCNMAAADKGK